MEDPRLCPLGWGAQATERCAGSVALAMCRLVLIGERQEGMRTESGDLAISSFKERMGWGWGVGVGDLPVLDSPR